MRGDGQTEAKALLGWWDVAGQGEGGRSSPTLCLQGRYPHPRSPQGWAPSQLGAPGLLPSGGACSAPIPALSIPWLLVCFPPSSTGQGIRKPGFAWKVRTQTWRDTHFRGLRPAPPGGDPSLL